MPSLQDILSLRPGTRPVPLLALVGGGGKTTTLFALASELAASGARVLVTTTTRIRDPRDEGRRIDRFVEDMDRLRTETAENRGSVTVLCAGVEEGKLVGLDPAAFPALAASGRWDAILAEADGAKMRPIKSPAPHEPVWPDGTTAALGFVGLDCLGRPLDDRIAHRPELLGPLAGIDFGASIELEHILRLARNPAGLFRGGPEGIPYALILNKADLRPDLDPGVLAAGAAASLGSSLTAAALAPASGPQADAIDIGLVLVCSLADPDSGRRVRAFRAVSREPFPRVY